ncbi:MAG: helix-turn-helix domain-containing protein [Planctomycetaceae bacterium]
MTKQLHLGAWTIDAHRERETLIGQLNLPRSLTTNNRTVSAKIVRAVLYRLHHYAGGNDWCWPSQSTLAETTDCAEKSVRRAVEAMERLGLIEVRRQRNSAGQVCNHYRIEWSAIQQRCGPQQHPETVPTERTFSTQTDTGTGCSETNQTDTGTGPNGHRDRTERTPGPPNKGDGDVLNAPPPSSRPRALTDGDGALRICWGRTIEPRELFDPPSLLPELLQAAAAQGVIKDCDADRLAFAALFAFAIRQKKSGNRIGLFTAMLSGRLANRWHPGHSRDWRTRPTDIDFEAARRWLRQIDDDDDAPPAQNAPAYDSRQEATREHQRNVATITQHLRTQRAAAVAANAADNEALAAFAAAHPELTEKR